MQWGDYHLEVYQPGDRRGQLHALPRRLVGQAPGSGESPGRLQVVSDKASYQAGETAQIQLRAPFAGEVLVAIAVIAACEDAALVWLESPTNPAMEVADIPAITAAAHAAGARVVVDNTFATPVVQQPLNDGVDVVLHSATKYLSGHSDLLMGALVTRDAELYAVLKGRRDLIGAIPGAFEAWLALRGLRTLHVRVERAQANAVELAGRLAEHPAITEVRYPGFGGMISIVLPDAAAADRLTHGTRLWVHATSLGGVESTLERRRRWASEQATIPEGLVRLSVGIEDVEDLWEDLAEALG